MTLSIRPVTLHDLPTLLTLFVDTINHTCKDDYSNQELKAWTASVRHNERWIKRIENQYFIAAIENNKIVGFGSLKGTDYLDLLFVHKDHLRKGIAHFMYENIEKQAFSKNCSKLITDSSRTAYPFYLKKGFKKIKENIQMLDGVEIINYHMTKELSI